MNTEMNSNMPMNNNNPSPKSNNAVLIVIIAIVLFAAGILVGKYILTTTESNKEENTNIKENTNITDDSTTTEVDKYAEYLESLSNSITKTYTEHTYAMDNYFNEMFSLKYTIAMNQNKGLFLNGYKIASNVLKYYVIPFGNGGYKSLYYITTEGKLFKSEHEEYLNEDKNDINTQELDYKNIVEIIPGIYSTDGLAKTYSPIFIDVDGNMFIEG